jgi:hypothetical protein
MSSTIGKCKGILFGEERICFREGRDPSYFLLKHFLSKLF